MFVTPWTPQVVVCVLRLLCVKKGGRATPGFIPLRRFLPYSRLSTETKLLNDSSVSLNINLLEIVKDTTSLTNESQK